MRSWAVNSCSILLYLLTLSAPARAGGEKGGAPLPGYPDWTIQEIRVDEGEGVLKKAYLLTPPEGRQARAVTEEVGGQLQTGSVDPETAYRSSAVATKVTPGIEVPDAEPVRAADIVPVNPAAKPELPQPAQAVSSPTPEPVVAGGKKAAAPGPNPPPKLPKGREPRESLEPRRVRRNAICLPGMTPQRFRDSRAGKSSARRKPKGRGGISN